ncbi:MAG: hypothetical protein ACI9EF_001310 [Pseudohongiellaceae bacterium]|jgi:hypothetical protein
MPELCPTVNTSQAQAELDQALAPLREQLISHPLYNALQDAATLRLFMKAHVFAVWDFQSLLKALQRQLTSVELPWMPTKDPEARRLMNEIVLAEESDEDGNGGYLSHYEIYLDAMAECGADAAPVQSLLEQIRGGADVQQALKQGDFPAGVAAFVSQTLSVAQCGEAHRIAAAFAYGREEVIPGMFRQLVDTLSAASHGSWTTLRYYLDLHIGLDSEVHGPQAKRLVSKLCGDDSRLWAEALATATTSLQSRLSFWDAVSASLPAPVSRSPSSDLPPAGLAPR